MRKGAPLGQHFLTNPRVASAVAHAASVCEGDVVLEVGPGKGILTDELLKLGTRVVAVEKDPRMLEILRDRFSREISTKQLALIEGDIRTYIQSPSFGRALGKAGYKVAANIPYYLTGELIRLLLETKRQPNSVSLLVQKEVAERIARDKKESILSISVKAYGTPKYVLTVKAGNFSPPPNVDSAILSISDISKKNFKQVTEEKFFEVVKTGFAQKRKTLGKLLKQKYGEQALAALGAARISPSERAERLTVSDWVTITEAL